MKLVRPIAIGLSPNVEIDDITLAIKNLISLNVFTKNIDSITKLKLWFHKKFGFVHTYPLNSGRSGLMLSLKASGISKGDEVIVPSFTCVAVPNSVIWVGAKPVYVDIKKDTFNYRIDDIKKKITKKTKAIIYQHTFGLPGDIDEVSKLAKEKDIILIEDCAHIIGGKYKGKLLGTYGDIAIFSFGRDKAVSSVFGGLVAITNSILAERFSSYFSQIEYSSNRWTIKQHIHIISMFFILPAYNFLNIGKALLVVLQKLSFVDKPVFSEEKHAQKPDIFPQKLHPALALLALNQLNKIDRFNSTRRNYSNKYNKVFHNLTNSDLPLLRYPLLINNRDSVLRELKKSNILLGNWYHNCIDPAGVVYNAIHYKAGSNTQFIADHIINLPTYPTFSESDFRLVIHKLKELEIEVL